MASSAVTITPAPHEIELDVVDLEEVKQPSGPAVAAVPALHFPESAAHDHEDHPASPALPARLIIEKVASDEAGDLADRLEKLKVSDHLIQQLKGDRKKEKVASFYTAQNEVLEGLKSMALAKPHSAEETDQDPAAVHRLLKISLSLTFVLIGLKMTSAIWSASVAVIASSMDSVLDVLSQGSLLLTSRLMRKYDPYKYPTGKARLEPLGVMVFAVIMGMAAIILLYQSVLVLKDGFDSTPDTIRMDAITLSLLGTGICIQVYMYFYCTRIARENNDNPSALAIAADNMNDVAINFVGVIPAVIAGYTSSAWFLDPLSAICIALYICFRWTVTCIQQLKTLVGRSASPQFIGQLAYLAAIHDSRILRVDTVLAYSVGMRLQVELHIVLPADMPLCEAHDIGESLEQKIESLESVEIAFVHLDYEFSHKPEHGRLKHISIKKE